MTEFVATIPSPETHIIYADKQSVDHWRENLSPILRDAHLALQHQSKKTPNILDLEKAIPTARDGVFLAPEFKNYQLIRIGQQRGVEDLQSRGGSAHNVSFGIAEVRTGESPKLKIIKIAVKQFTKTESALKDAYNNVIALNRGFRTTHPIALISEETGSYLLSVARPEVKSLDMEPWQQFGNGDLLTDQYFEELLFRVSTLLAALHCKGIRHSDAQIKNFWLTPRGNTEAIDWEASTIYPNPPSKDQYITSAIDDLRILFQSLAGEKADFDTRILSGSKQGQWIKFMDLVLRHYVEYAFLSLVDHGIMTDEEALSVFSISLTDNASEKSLINHLRSELKI
ncbi:hypothetical protein HY389_02430 [Candidatus Daviesbacteria bacterium]|nr:hypothetical protein [Candidatus Daviesbacteria bacterium]